MQDIETGTKLIPGFSAVAFLPHGPRYIGLKRAIDVLLVVVLLSVFGILIPPIALAIKLLSPGPVLYRQKRIGLGGKPFEMLKFRTMTVDPHDSTHREHVQRLIRENLRPEDLGAQSLKKTTSARVTRIGKVLRNTSLDELPQLFNVLRGDMSLIGPRPPLPYEYEVYSEWHKQRQSVRPGITGLWQVAARNRVSFDEMVKLDLAYIATMNPWLDLNIIIRTPRAMLRGE